MLRMLLRKTPVYIPKIIIAAVIALLCAGVSGAAERWHTITWDGDASEIAKFEAFCAERGMTSFEVLEANGYPAGELPSKGDELLVPESRGDLLATWMEAQGRSGGPRTLVTIRPHGIPVELRENVPAAEITAPVPEPIPPAVIPEPAVPDETTEITEPFAVEEQPAPPDAPSRERGLSVRELLAQTQETPLVTIRPHGIPSSMRDRPEETRRDTATVTVTVTEMPPEPPAPEPPLPQISRPIETETRPDDPIKNIRIVVSGDEIALLARQQPENALRDPAPSTPAPAPAPVPAIVEREIPAPQPPVREPPPVTPPVVSGVPEAPDKMTWPVSGRVSSGFGRRGRRSFHSGIDIPMPSGTPIVAAMDGVVLLTATSRDARYRGYGNTVLLYHGNGIVTLYAHCSRIDVSKGQEVRRGDIIALVGNTGRTTTHHVHFEVRVNGRPVDPIPYLAQR